MGSDQPSSTNKVLRWFLVLPGAIVVAVLIQFPLHWAALSLTHDRSFVQISPERAAALERALVPSVAAFGFVFGGACIAPTRKRGTSILLSLFFVVTAHLLRPSLERWADVSSLPFAFVNTTRILILHTVGVLLGVLSVFLKYRGEARIAPRLSEPAAHIPTNQTESETRRTHPYKEG